MNRPSPGTDAGGGSGADVPSISSARTSGRRRRLHSDLIAAIGFAAFCAGAFVATFEFELSPAALTPAGMGPEAFPRLLLVVLFALIGLLAWSSLKRPVESQPPIPVELWLTGLALAAYPGLVSILGMSVANVVVVFGIGRLWGERRLLLLAGNAIGISAALHFLFVDRLGTVLPEGALGFLF